MNELVLWQASSTALLLVVISYAVSARVKRHRQQQHETQMQQNVCTLKKVLHARNAKINRATEEIQLLTAQRARLLAELETCWARASTPTHASKASTATHPVKNTNSLADAPVEPSAEQGFTYEPATGRSQA